MSDSHGDHGHHAVSLELLIGVFVALLILTVATVGVTFVDLGPLNIIVAMGIATLKGTLVVLYFMHLRWDNPFNAFLFLTAITFVLIMIGFMIVDTAEYAPNIDAYERMQVSSSEG